jgi:ElaB/YqjD/DUF883 family membrane-anchored ribosome-binding protein
MTLPTEVVRLDEAQSLNDEARGLANEVERLLRGGLLKEAQQKHEEVRQKIEEAGRKIDHA